VVLDIGAGDGAWALHVARREPRTLAVALDAERSRLIDPSRRAARPARKGGLANALFVWAAAEALPIELAGRCDLVTVHLPWGSLLRGVAAAEPWWLEALRGLLGPNGRVELLLSVVERDGAVPPLDDGAIGRLTAAYEAAGFRALQACPVPAHEAAARSTWARRLRAGTPERPAWLVSLERADPAAIRTPDGMRRSAA
jgi:SAM-dependent methyltransferase